ncbi:uncharacterized protein EV422DRAFT_504482 [Fimicolochytrium jonesii]|uniref:uncharacterized protein n=1 Tax=Fimicolochytrium jonesii TaxID=1396493 RepID=UPI0022FE7D91|nr:uncharacterized protein EV422DRAFT_504482 [Fimicolochytrium jonesii]KAI8824499.1 hypothetical protein EV422DRAFT_504482 [Fimicolochytrium jonesii]
MSQSSAAVTPAVPAGVPSTSPPISNPAAGTPGNPPIPNSPGGTPANTPASLATGTAVNTPASNPVSGTPVNAPVTSPVSGTSQNTPASNPAGGTSANAPQPSSPPASTGSRPGSDPNSDHTSDHTSGNSGHTNMTSANGPFATKARILTLSEAMALVADHPQKAMLAAPIFLFICIVGMFLSYIVTLYQSTFPHATWNASLDAAGKYVEHKESDASIVYARKPTTNARSVKHDDDEGRMGGKLVHKSSLTRLPSKSRPRYQTAAAAAAAAGGSNNTDNSQHLAPWEPTTDSAPHEYGDATTAYADARADRHCPPVSCCCLPDDVVEPLGAGITTFAPGFRVPDDTLKRVGAGITTFAPGFRVPDDALERVGAGITTFATGFTKQRLP